MRGYALAGRRPISPVRRGAGWATLRAPRDPPRLDQQAARQANPLPRRLRGDQPGGEGRPRRPQRLGQDDRLPPRHARGGAGRRAGRHRSRRHHRVLQPRRGGDGRALGGRRGDGGRRPGLRGRRRAGRAGARARRPGPDGRDGPARGAIRPRAGPLRGAGGLRARGAYAGGAGRPRLHGRDAGRRRRRALGGVEDARRARPHPGDAPGRDAARRAHQPPGHRVHPLARGVPEAVRGRAVHDVPRPGVHEPDRDEDPGDRGRRHPDVLRELRLLRAAARRPLGPGRGAVRAAAGHAGEGGGVHRALQGQGQPRRAGPVAREEAREDREGRAAEAEEDARLRLPRAAALRRGRARRSRASPRRTAIG